MSEQIVQVFCDGGVITANPSVIGGTWAWVQVGLTGERIKHGSGVVVPSQVGLPKITNNLTELLAVLEAVAHLSDGWHGTILTDSQVTLRRIDRRNRNPAMNGIPEFMVKRVREMKARLGVYGVTLLAGHPTQEDLRKGRKQKGAISNPVSAHNVFCDWLCNQQSIGFQLSYSVLSK